eukprot:COSAG03_NODE_4602_length_1493_cov_1.767575_1_plen_417_part_10
MNISTSHLSEQALMLGPVSPRPVLEVVVRKCASVNVSVRPLVRALAVPFIAVQYLTLVPTTVGIGPSSSAVPLRLTVAPRPIPPAPVCVGQLSTPTSLVLDPTACVAAATRPPVRSLAMLHSTQVLTLIRRTVEGDTDRQIETATGLRSWRSTREELSEALEISPRSGTERHEERRRVTVPTNVAAMLQTTLGGPERQCAGVLRCVRRVWQVRAWCGCWPVIGACSGYSCLVFKDGTFAPSPTSWAAVGYFGFFAYTSIGVICSMATYEMADIVGAMVGENDRSGGRPSLDAGLLSLASTDRAGDTEKLHDAPPGRPRENPSRLFLRGLMQCEISLAASQVLAQQVKRSMYQSALISLLVGVMMVMNYSHSGRAEQLLGTDSDHLGLLLTSIAFWVTFCPCAMAVGGWLIFLKAPWC